MWLTDEQQQIWRGYLEMVSRLQTAMHRQLQQDCELSLPDYDVLVALSERGPLRINELGDDRRGATAEVTDAGRTALDTAAPGHVELVRSAVFDGLSAPQLRAFGSVIESVVGRLTSPLR